MAVRHAEAWNGLRTQELVQQDGIYHRTGEGESSDYRRRWENEAAEDHVRSAIAGGQTKSLDYEAITGKISPIWQRFPGGSHFDTVVEIGAGYGRIPRSTSPVTDE